VTNLGIIAAFAWRDRRKPWKTSQTRNRDLRNTKQKFYPLNRDVRQISFDATSVSLC